ncbi:MAG: GNAT family N-acetyltransferase, partial [Proteobacteria bacterium]|nr:GNAT family N-acetyltransferase [Pseudomonadota bacterium]
MTITYAIENGLGVDEFVDVLKRSGLAERRPVDEADVIRAMVDNADLTITARDGEGRLVGVARSVTDFAYCCYLSELAVDRDCQRSGIGRELMARTKDAAGGDKPRRIVYNGVARRPAVRLPKGGGTQMPEYETYDPSKHNRDTPQETFGPVVKIDRHEDGRIFVITLNRPHRMNSIGDGLNEAMYDAWVEYRDDPDARVAILTGAGSKAFCA